MKEPTTPDHILQLGLGFWGSKVLLSAVEIGVFSELAGGPQRGTALIDKLALHPRGAEDFLDALVSLGMLARTGDGYSNTPSTDLFLDRAKPSYLGGLLEMANARLYPFWGSLTEALKTGEPQNESKVGEDFFDVLYQDPERLRQFMRAMTGISMGAANAIAERFPWEKYRTFMDIGGAEGCLAVQVALRHGHLHGGNFDLPPVQESFDEYIRSFDLGERLSFYPGNFFEESLPSADVLVMGHILHDWSLDEKLLLLEKAYASIPDGGALIVYDAIIDDERRENSFGLLMSLNMLIETEAGFDYTGADCSAWMQKVGFTDTYLEYLVGPDSMVVGFK